jgi:F0F1-type ATP synthase membrane subunit b/b'
MMFRPITFKSVAFRPVIMVLALLAFMAASAVFAYPEAAKADNDKAEFQQKAKAQFNEFDMKFRQWSDKAKGQSGKVYHEQKKELEKSRIKASKNIHRLNAEGKVYGEEYWRKLKEETDRSLSEFGKALERAGAKFKERIKTLTN